MLSLYSSKTIISYKYILEYSFNILFVEKDRSLSVFFQMSIETITKFSLQHTKEDHTNTKIKIPGWFSTQENRP